MVFYSFNSFYFTDTFLLISFFHFNKVSHIPYGIFLHLSFSFFLSFLGLSLTILRQFTCRNLIGALFVSKISFFKYHDIIMQMMITPLVLMYFFFFRVLTLKTTSNNFLLNILSNIILLARNIFGVPILCISEKEVLSSFYFHLI